MQPLRVVSPDGTVLAAQEWGNPGGREIVLIHGFCQSHLSWSRQVNDADLAARFRMVTYDLRGHGASEKPADRKAYEADRLWADDLAAVIATAGLKRPYLVGWSYAGRVIADYLGVYGSAGIAGINFVNARCSTDPTLFGGAQRHLRGMQSDDPATNIEATRAFIRACFEQQPSPEDFETMVAFNMKVPPVVRRYVLHRKDETPGALAALDRPVLVTHGRQDDIILSSMAEFIAKTVKGATLSFYDGVGHAPFWEASQRFNAELSAFIDAQDSRG